MILPVFPNSRAPVRLWWSIWTRINSFYRWKHDQKLSEDILEKNYVSYSTNHRISRQEKKKQLSISWNKWSTTSDDEKLWKGSHNDFRRLLIKKRENIVIRVTHNRNPADPVLAAPSPIQEDYRLVAGSCLLGSLGPWWPSIEDLGKWVIAFGYLDGWIGKERL